MFTRIEINSSGFWETALDPESKSDEPTYMSDAERDLPEPGEELDALLLAIAKHNRVPRNRVRVVVEGVPQVEVRPGTQHFNLGTEEGAVQVPHVGAPSEEVSNQTPTDESPPEGLLKMALAAEPHLGTCEVCDKPNRELILKACAQCVAERTDWSLEDFLKVWRSSRTPQRALAAIWRNGRRSDTARDSAAAD